MQIFHPPTVSCSLAVSGRETAARWPFTVRIVTFQRLHRPCHAERQRPRRAPPDVAGREARRWPSERRAEGRVQRRHSS
jgi:hypothetical protein